MALDHQALELDLRGDRGGMQPLECGGPVLRALHRPVGREGRGLRRGVERQGDLAGEGCGMGMAWKGSGATTVCGVTGTMVERKAVAATGRAGTTAFAVEDAAASRGFDAAGG